MTKILDIVKPGAVTGENLQKLFAFARENGFAFPSVNCVGTDSINAVIEAGAKAKSPVMVQFSNGGASFIAGKGIKVDRPQGAAIQVLSLVHYTHVTLPNTTAFLLLFTLTTALRSYFHGSTVYQTLVRSTTQSTVSHYSHHT